jgi:hypothetical protein
VQQRIRDGELFHFAPFSEEKRLETVRRASVSVTAPGRIATTAQSPP